MTSKLRNSTVTRDAACRMLSDDEMDQSLSWLLAHRNPEASEVPIELLRLWLRETQNPAVLSYDILAVFVCGKTGGRLADVECNLAAWHKDRPGTSFLDDLEFEFHVWAQKVALASFGRDEAVILSPFKLFEHSPQHQITVRFRRVYSP